MVSRFTGLIVTRSGSIPCVGAVSSQEWAPPRGVLSCESFSMDGFLVYALAAEIIGSGAEWAPVVRFERVEPHAGGSIYSISFLVEVGADGVS